MFKYLAYFFLILLLLGIVLGFAFRKKILRINKIKHLFDKDQITYNFMHMDEIFPMNRVAKGDKTYLFKEGQKITLPKTFQYKDKTIETESFLTHINNSGFLIIQNDSIIYESYKLGHQPSTRHISWSVSKSFVSALFGIALEEGKIKSIDEKVTDYVPELKGSGYDNVSIKDVLQMSSGVAFNEDYADFYSDINRMGRTIAMGTSLDDFAASLKRDKSPGKIHHYVSIDTHVLGMIIRKATGQPMHEYLEEKIWKKIGMESDGYWIKDDHEVSFILGGMNATLRDYARFGRLFLRNGNWEGEQLVPESWVKASITPDAPHLLPGYDNPLSSSEFGYGFQWWLPVEPDGDFMASGIHSQSIYINQKKNLVISFNSSNAYFNDPDDESKGMFTALFQTIAKTLPDVETMETTSKLKTN